MLEVMGIQVELSSPGRQLKNRIINIKIEAFWGGERQRKSAGAATHIIWVSCKLLVSVEVGLADCDMAECSALARRPAPNNPFSSSLKEGILWPSLVCASRRQKEVRG